MRIRQKRLAKFLLIFSTYCIASSQTLNGEANAVDLLLAKTKYNITEL
jgi:hypothetical protein